tara:strand:+ start:9566 stop:10018 length:453 start_codon:yes stop_codon:yes gene_type:complete
LKLILALHIIAVVCWFAGLFYLPRLFVYHASNSNEATSNVFKIMEHKLYYYITTPSAVLTTVFGSILLFHKHHYYAGLNWMHLKLFLVGLLWVYHISCGYYVSAFKYDQQQKSERFFRFFNEIPTILLISIVLLVVIKPYLGPNIFWFLN